MKLLCILLPLLFSTNCGFAAITITVAPTSIGGTTFFFSQTITNPKFLVSDMIGGGIFVQLPPSMFSFPTTGSGGGSTYTGGTFEPVLATFTDTFSGSGYNVDSIRIGGAILQLGFDRRFAPDEVQSEGQLDLVPGSAVATAISPAAFTLGIHSVSSTLFGVVTVNVIPEPASALLLGLVSLFLLRRNRSF